MKIQISVNSLKKKTVHIPFEISTGAGLRETIDSALNSLSDREAKVLRMRFGIGMPDRTYA